jgi:archaellin
MDRSMIGLLVALVIVAIAAYFLLDPKGTGTARRAGETVRETVQETADRLDNAFDAAKEDVQNIRRP